MEKVLALITRLNKKGIFHLIVSNYSVQFIVFGSHLLIAKIMTPEDLGVIKTIETFVNMANVLGGGGVIFALLKIIPENRNREIREYTLLFSIKYAVIFSTVIFITFNLLAYLRLISQDEKLIFWFHQYSLIIIPSVLIMLLIRYYQAINLFKRISTVIFILKLISVVFVIVSTYLFFIRGYVLSMVITTTLVMASLIYDARKKVFVTFFSEDLTEIKKKIQRLSKMAFFAQIIDQLKLHSGFLIANFLIYDRVMFGHYAFALIVVQGLNIILTSVQQFIIPKMSEISYDNSLFFRKLKHFESKLLLVSTPIFILSELILPLIIEVVFGNKYDEAIPLLRIMIIGWYIQSFYTLKGIAFLSLGKMKYVSYYSLSILLVSAPLMYWLNIKFGAIGASMSYFTQNCISYFTVFIFLRRLKRRDKQ